MSLAARKIRLVLMLRQAGVTDPQVLSALELVPRELFVPELFRDRAYENEALPIGHGQTISKPVVVGIMTQALRVGGRSRVLEIGTGSGYQTAVLARLCRRVYTIERHRELLVAARERLHEIGLDNVTTIVGDGSAGWPQIAPVDRIIACAAVPEVPTVLADQLAEDGVMVIPVGKRGDGQRLVRVTRLPIGFRTEDLGPIRFLPMARDAERVDDDADRDVDEGAAS